MSNYFIDKVYHDGYFKALLDVKNWYENHSEIIKYYKLSNYNGILLILNKLIEKRNELMEYAEDIEIIIKPEEMLKKKIMKLNKYENSKSISQ